jgi:hypothetical protein
MTMTMTMTTLTVTSVFGDQALVLYSGAEVPGDFRLANPQGNLLLYIEADAIRGGPINKMMMTMMMMMLLTPPVCVRITQALVLYSGAEVPGDFRWANPNVQVLGWEAFLSLGASVTDAQVIGHWHSLQTFDSF